ncbi:MAG: PQQ-binding-like beta-propeller repeat protein [Vicinamibacterales bacterium]|nr:PQQ-binding-like beta-propeller repeat protein [Vicinamibacterales bacterium]
MTSMTSMMVGQLRLSAWTALCLCLLGAHSVAQEPRPGVDWPQFRGVHARGVADGFGAPTRWNAETGENILWSTPIPGLGHSSPVVWGALFCVTTSDSGQDDELKVGLYGDITPVVDETAQQWQVHCLDKLTGAERWTAVAHQGVPMIPRHPKSTHANSTLATDGTHLVAMFGSEGLYAYDLATGREIWSIDLGLLESGFFSAPTALWGFAASPIIHDDIVVIQADVLNGSFLAAFDVATGEEIWRAQRDEVPTWSTPTAHVVNGRAQIVVNGFRHIGGYDLATGRELWRMTGGGDIPTPTPVIDDGLIFITNAHGLAAPIYAIREGASGDITPTAGARSNDHVVWSQGRDGAYMQTPVVYDGLLYNCRDNGVLSVYEPRTGRRLYQERISRGGSGFSASPVAADGKVYFSSEDGSVYVVRAGPDFEVVAENPMGETLMATPALSEGALYIRTRSLLVAVQ